MKISETSTAGRVALARSFYEAAEMYTPLVITLPNIVILNGDAFIPPLFLDYLT